MYVCVVEWSEVRSAGRPARAVVRLADFTLGVHAFNVRTYFPSSIHACIHLNQCMNQSSQPSSSSGAEHGPLGGLGHRARRSHGRTCGAYT